MATTLLKLAGTRGMIELFKPHATTPRPRTPDGGALPDEMATPWRSPEETSAPGLSRLPKAPTLQEPERPTQKPCPPAATDTRLLKLRGIMATPRALEGQPVTL